MKKWSEEAWSLAEPIYREILNLPFVKELAAGTLSRERFLFYIKQDSIYVENYAHVLGHVASRLPHMAQMEDFLRYALDGVAMERILHESYLGAEGRGDAKATPTCLLYNSYESAMGLQAVEVEAAVILPCFWVYQKVGSDIVAQCNPEGNPYEAWIKAYSDPYMEQSTTRAIEILDELAEAASPAVRAQMTEAFVNATRMEWMFWDSAYKMEKWPI